MAPRPMCEKCPWRDLGDCESVVPGIVEHARSNPDGFVCHVRMGPCDGPRRALKIKETADAES